METVNIPLQSRLTAFLNIEKELPERRRAVLNALRALGGSGTMHQVAEYLHVPLNTISGRFSELRKVGKIEAVGFTAEKNRKSVFRVVE